MEMAIGTPIRQALAKLLLPGCMSLALKILMSSGTIMADRARLAMTKEMREVTHISRNSRRLGRFLAIFNSPSTTRLPSPVSNRA